MRIKSVAIRNYRVHRDLRIDLDQSCTLIGGPNECGKSTLIEAIHRAFFLKAKGNTEQHRAMVSTSHNGHPEVEIHFESDGAAYHLKKRFGSSGTTTLAPSSAPSLAGDAAESELARILGVESGVAGRAVAAQWSHLWIWQGCSGEDPLEHAAAQQANLLRRLQDSGGAAAMQSELDSQVAQHFASATDSIFTQAGRSKAGSDLAKAEEAAAAAEKTRQAAATRHEQSLQFVRDFEDASQTITRAAGEIVMLSGQKAEVEKKIARVDELRAQEAAQSGTVQGLSERRAAIDKVHRQVVDLRARVEADEAALAPRNEEAARLTDARSKARHQSESDARAYDAACDGTRKSRQRRDLAVAILGRLEKSVRLAELTARLEEAGKHDAAISELRTELAKLPEIDAAKLRKLQKIEAALTGAEATLHAMAAGLEVASAIEPVLVDGVPLAVGEARILTEDTEVTVGQGLRIVIRPGGGTSLAEARQNADDARQEFRKALDTLGVASVTEASEIVAKRSEFESRIGAAEAALRGLDAKNLQASFADARDAAAAAEAEVVRRLEVVPGFTASATLPEAKNAVSLEEQSLRDADAAEAQAKRIREIASAAFQSADEALAAYQQAIAEHTKRIADSRAQLRLLVETHGEDPARLQALAEADKDFTIANQELAATRRALAELQPDLLTADFARLRTALERAETQRNEAKVKQAVAQAGLRTEGADDPAAALALAVSHARAAQEHLAGVRRKAEAFRLLNRLFLEEQRALADRFTKPLADKISGYLECLFGPGTRARIVLADNAFSGLQLVRPSHAGGAVPFDNLSGGAREQVAAAVRLAMAEVLCDDHHGCLPVIFDDAFAYSDPDRVQILQRMLYLAASRGLQVIVLTCAPSDYAALGARLITLRIEKSEIFAPGTTPPGDAFTPEDFSEDESESPSSGAGAAVTAEQCDRLLAVLRENGGKSGNQTLRQILGWDEATYEAIKDRLIESGELKPGRGRGGSLALSSV